MNLSNDNSTIKFLVYILIFLVMILLLLIVFIIPNIKSYKINKADLNTFSQKNKTLSQKKIELKERIEEIKTTNKEVNSRFTKEFDKAKFIASANNYLQNVKLTKVTDINDSSFDEYKFTAQTPTKSPENFYKFIDSLKDYNNVIKMNFPISLLSKDNKIELNFNIGVYKNIKK